ncbi:unnamed protein product [Periconia digitata]|uniref:F-box domain-containing protein n=1 Tax=Periconia digitata TaxID=1303443 RepID=A0A9W4XYU5_9PLEO|nr:unnamed protein product [Periconia digitata]
MLLFNLPSEIIGEILNQLEPAAFYVCLQTAKLFRDNALSSKALIRAHLARIPGQRVLSEEVENSPDALLGLFEKRANQHLFNSAGAMADVFAWFPEQTMHSKLSGLLCWKGLSKQELKMWKGLSKRDLKTENTHILAYCEVQPEKAIVTLYSIEDYGVHGHRPQISHIISPRILLCQGALVDHQYKIMKVTSVKFGIAVLYAPLQSIHQSDSEHVLLGQEWKLLLFHLESGHGVSLYRSYNIRPQGSVFIDLAFDSDGNPVVCWKTHAYNNRGMYTSFQVTRHHHPRNSQRVQEVERHRTLELSIDTRSAQDYNYMMSMRGKHIDIIPAPAHLPHYTSPYVDHEHSALFESRDPEFPESIGIFTRPSFGYTLATHHYCSSLRSSDTFGASNGERGCVNTALKFAISREALGASPLSSRKKQGAFLVKAFDFADSCHDFDWDEDRFQQQYLVVARLIAHPDLCNLSTLGLIVAVSPGAHRIAVSSWRTLVVYSLDPQAFLDPDYSLSRAMIPAPDLYMLPSYPENQKERCGWEYYSNANIIESCVELEPVRLECKGVVYGLEWRDENELWGWAENGLVRWTMGSMMKGARGYGSIGGDWLEKANWMDSLNEKQ